MSETLPAGESRQRPVYALSPATQGLLLFVLYSAILVGTVWWASSLTHVTIYDKYLVRFEGVSFPVTDLRRSSAFYSTVLNFVPIAAPTDGASATPSSGEHPFERTGFLLPDRRKLFLEHRDVAPSAPPPAQSPLSPGAVLRVRNGFERLHRELSRRLKQFHDLDPTPLPTPETISPLRTQPWGEEFEVKDSSGNSLIFLKPKRRSTTRL